MTHVFKYVMHILIVRGRIG